MTSIVLTPTQIQKVLTENQVAPTDPGLPPDPVAPEPIPAPSTPLPPVLPIPDPDPDAHNMRFVNLFGSKLEFGYPRGNIYRWEDIRVYKNSMSMEISLPIITSACVLQISKASSSLPSNGVRLAVFSYHRGFHNPISIERWGNGALSVELGPTDSERTMFFNVRFSGNEIPWGLRIQPSAYKA